MSLTKKERKLLREKAVILPAFEMFWRVDDQL